jgi:hypothetical protein
VARNPYRTARQEHLADMLDQLQRDGLLLWQWDYKDSSAIYWVTPAGQCKLKLSTKQAEELVSQLCEQQGIVWFPVPQPGGENERTEILRKIAELRGLQPPAPSTLTPNTPIEAVPFNLSAYPALENRLSDGLTDDRSSQVYSLARSCIELGLSDGQVKWLLAQYPPFVDKFGGRPGADLQLNRVVHQARKDATR